MGVLADLERWVPHLSPETVQDSKNKDKYQTSKEVFGSHSPANEDTARHLVQQAIKISQEPGRLTDAADLIEEALNKFPALREEYQGRLKLWRRGIAM